MDLFSVSEDDKRKIHELYEKNEDDIKRDVKIIEEWIKEQPHLPQNFQFDGYIEKCLLHRKFRVDSVKDKIENYFSLKNKNRDFFEAFGSEDFVGPSKASVTYIPLPKLGPENERLLLVRIRDSDNFDFDHYLRAATALYELLIRYDYCNGIRIVADCQNCTFGHIRKVSLSKLTRSSRFVLKGYPFRIVGVDVVNVKPFVKSFLTVMKTIIRHKVFDRIRFYDTTDSWSKSLPKECIPEDYGGEAKNISEIIREMDYATESHRDYLITGLNYVADESRRLSKSRVPDFQKLSLD